MCCNAHNRAVGIDLTVRLSKSTPPAPVLATWAAGRNAQPTLSMAKPIPPKATPHLGRFRQNGAEVLANNCAYKMDALPHNALMALGKMFRSGQLDMTTSDLWSISTPSRPSASQAQSDNGVLQYGINLRQRGLCRADARRISERLRCCDQLLSLELASPSVRLHKCRAKARCGFALMACPVASI